MYFNKRKIMNYFFIVSLLSFSHAMEVEKKKTITERLQEHWKGYEKKLKEALTYTALYKSQMAIKTKDKQRERTLGDFDGKSEWVTTYFLDEPQHMCKFDELKKILGLNMLEHVNESEKDGPGGVEADGEVTTIEEKNVSVQNNRDEHSPLMNEGPQQEKGCCCVLY